MSNYRMKGDIVVMHIKAAPLHAMKPLGGEEV
jgi:hypothetical protein